MDSSAGVRVADVADGPFAGCGSNGALARGSCVRAVVAAGAVDGAWESRFAGEVREATGADSRRARGAGRAGAAGWLGAGVNGSAAGGAVSVAGAPSSTTVSVESTASGAAAGAGAGALTSSVTIG